MSFGNILNWDAFQLGFSAIPRTLIDGQTVRFFPKIMKEEQPDYEVIRRLSTCPDGRYWLSMPYVPYIYSRPAVVEFYSTGTLPSPLVPNRAYYPSEWGYYHTYCWDDSAEDMQVSEAPGWDSIEITDDGVGTHYVRQYRIKELCGFLCLQMELSTSNMSYEMTSPWLACMDANQRDILSLQVDDVITTAQSEITEIPAGTYYVVAKDGSFVSLSTTKGGSPIEWTGAGSMLVEDYQIPPFSWYFGDGTGSNLPMPTHCYKHGVTEKTCYLVALQICDSSGFVTSSQMSDFITVDTDENLPEVPSPNALLQTLVLKHYTYDEYHEPTTFYLPITRAGNLECPFRLSNVISEESMDKIGTLKFRILNLGDATETQIGALAEGNRVDLFVGNDVTFSGIIRRVTNATQAGFKSSTRVNVFDVECDSHLAELKMFTLDPWILTNSGEYVSDSPGNLLRRVMSPTSVRFWDQLAGDYRGIIQCVDANTAYKINSSNTSESAGSHYQHAINLHELTTYDLRVRVKQALFPYHHIEESGGGPES
jgi:hypothetical protein